MRLRAILEELWGNTCLVISDKNNNKNMTMQSTKVLNF